MISTYQVARVGTAFMRWNVADIHTLRRFSRDGVATEPLGTRLDEFDRGVFRGGARFP